MRVALAQMNPTVGDLTGNVERMIQFAREAAARNADTVVFPELSLNGYPPRDLVEKESFLARTEEQLQRLAQVTTELRISILCGYVGRPHAPQGRRATNSAALLCSGHLAFRQDKMLLPNYDVFDEARHFVPAERQSLTSIANRRCAITICEDAWNDKDYWSQANYRRDPVEELARGGAEVILSINASPYHMDKRALRRDIFAAIARKYDAPVVYVNQVGGNDHLVFDGSSFAMDSNGRIIAAARSFAEDLVVADLVSGTGDSRSDLDDEPEAVYEALVLGTRDYIRKCGFWRVLIGLSGGIDSSLTAAIAVDAVGRENVTGVAMPGPYSSDHSITDARDMAKNLGIEFHIIGINDPYSAFLSTLSTLR